MEKIYLLLLAFLLSLAAPLKADQMDKDIIVLRGFLFEEVWKGTSFADQVLEHLPGAKIKIAGGIRGEVFSSGEFKIQLPRKRYGAGMTVRVIISAKGYYQVTPETVFVFSEQSRNEELKFYLKREKSNPIVIVGTVLNSKDNTPVKNVMVVSKQFQTVNTVTDVNGNYKLKIFTEDAEIMQLDLSFRHEDFKYKVGVISNFSSTTRRYALDAKIRPKKGKRSRPDTVSVLDRTNHVYPVDPDVIDYEGNSFIHYTWGKKKDLMRKGILHKNGSFLFRWFKKPKLNPDYKPDPDFFQKARKHDVKYIRANLDKIFYQRDVYPARPEHSFFIDGNGILRITDPIAFWRNCNFVIIRVH